jgi:hypothetical protein
MDYMQAIESDMIKAQCKDAVREQLLKIPEGSEYHAHRYYTDNEIVLHLWDDKGNSYDIRVVK